MKVSQLHKFFYLLCCAGLLSLPAVAQVSNEPQMADLMRSNGKIYVVVAVMMVIFIGIVAYLFYIDKKLKRLEQQAETTS